MAPASCFEFEEIPFVECRGILSMQLTTIGRSWGNASIHHRAVSARHRRSLGPHSSCSFECGPVGSAQRLAGRRYRRLPARWRDVSPVALFRSWVFDDLPDTASRQLELSGQIAHPAPLGVAFNDLVHLCCEDRFGRLSFGWCAATLRAHGQISYADSGPAALSEEAEPPIPRTEEGDYPGREVLQKWVGLTGPCATIKILFGRNVNNTQPSRVPHKS